MINPSVSLKLADLSYTLSERRSRHFHRAYVVTNDTEFDEGDFVFGKKSTEAPKVGFVFTGQGAQWPQMGKALVENFPIAKALIQCLDTALQNLDQPPSWSLLGKLLPCSMYVIVLTPLDELVEPRSAEHLRKPEFSQPLTTALQLAMVAVLSDWGVSPMAVVGHSSGEIAAAYTAGIITLEDAIKIAYFRGQSCVSDHDKPPLGMLAVGLGDAEIQKYISPFHCIQVGCFNSPSSTLSGSRLELEKVKDRLMAEGHFARMLQVDFAYHSVYMTEYAASYEELLFRSCGKPGSQDDNITLFSSVTGKKLDSTCDSDYWKTNMTSPVRFNEAVQEMVSAREGTNFLIEIGPSGALAGPIKQILEIIAGDSSKIQYAAAWNRGKESIKSLFNVAGKLFVAGGFIRLAEVNKFADASEVPLVIVDLPNYSWNHSTKYWYESEASKDWRFRKFAPHDLLGSKILGTSWNAPSWKKTLRVENLRWLKDHRVGITQTKIATTANT